MYSTALYSPVSTTRSPYVCMPHSDDHNDSNVATISKDACVNRTSDATSPTSSLASSLDVATAQFVDTPSNGHENDRDDHATCTAATTDDDILRSIARSAMRRVRSAAVSSSAFTRSSDWTPRQQRRGSHATIYEQRSARAFHIAAQSTVPCTIDELSHVLASDDSDQLNASLLDILGDQFNYAVTVRAVPLLQTAPNERVRGATATTADLSIKFLSLGRRSSRLLRTRSQRHVSTKRSVTLLDFVETDAARGTACRVIQTIQRSQDLATHAGECRPDAVGDALAGYVLQEDPATKHTTVFFFGAHDVGAGSSASTNCNRLRQSTIQTLRKMTCGTDKWVAIVRRRRLGATPLLQGPRSLSLSSSSSLQSFASTCFMCDASFQPLLLRKKHFCCLCGYYTCGRCSRGEDAEERIGVVHKVRVCVHCLDDVSRSAFQSV